jgi:hypothetical protein
MRAAAPRWRASVSPCGKGRAAGADSASPRGAAAPDTGTKADAGAGPCPFSRRTADSAWRTRATFAARATGSEVPATSDASTDRAARRSTVPKRAAGPGISPASGTGVAACACVSAMNSASRGASADVSATSISRRGRSSSRTRLSRIGSEYAAGAEPC